jgi:hypothetical protein
VVGENKKVKPLTKAKKGTIMKNSYAKASTAKTIATKMTKQTGKEHVVTGPDSEGQFFVKEVQFFPAAPVVKAKVKMGKGATKKIETPVSDCTQALVTESTQPAAEAPVADEVPPVVEPSSPAPAPAAEEPAPAKKKSATPEGLRPAAWKFIKQQLPEQIEEVHVRHGNGKRYLLTVNGAQVWYSFEESTAKIAKAAVLALVAA